MRQRVERSDRTLLVTSAPQDVYAIKRKETNPEYQEFLNIRPLDREGLKELHSSIIAGKNLKR